MEYLVEDIIDKRGLPIAVLLMLCIGTVPKYTNFSVFASLVRSSVSDAHPSDLTHPEDT